MRLLQWLRRVIRRHLQQLDPPCPYGCRTSLEFRLVRQRYGEIYWIMRCSQCGARTPGANTKRRALKKARAWSGKW